MNSEPHRRAVLFDVDGVLLDSVAAHHAVWRRWAGERGLDPAAVAAASNGRRPEDTVRLVAPALDPATERKALDELTRRSRAVVREFAGAAELLGSLPPDRWAIVTSGSAWYVRRAFRRRRLPLPSVQVYGEDVANSKPAPDGYLLACQRLGARPGDCLVLEDSAAGVQAGKAAGCLVLAVTGVPPAGPLARADVWAPGLPAATPAIRAWLAVRPGGVRYEQQRRIRLDAAP